MLVMQAWFESETILNQRVLDARVGDGHDDDEVIVDRDDGVVSSTSGLNVKNPFTVGKGRVGLQRFLKWIGVLAHVLFPLDHTLSVGEGGPNITAFVVPETRREVS